MSTGVYGCAKAQNSRWWWWAFWLESGQNDEVAFAVNRNHQAETSDYISMSIMREATPLPLYNIITSALLHISPNTLAFALFWRFCKSRQNAEVASSVGRLL